MAEKRWLPEVEYRVLATLPRAGGAVRLEELAQEAGLDPARVKVALDALAAEGLVQVEETSVVELRLGPKARALGERPLPERAVVEALAGGEGVVSLRDLAAVTGLEKKIAGESLKWLVRKGWARREKGTLQLTDAGRAAAGHPAADELLLAHLREKGPAAEEALRAAGLPVPEARKLLADRPGFLEVRERRRRAARLTEAGRRLLEAGVAPRQEVTRLTPELLAEGRWREVYLKPYDVTLPAQPRYPGKEHPLRRVLEETRRVFLEMGFTETRSPWCESAFWDFDALFQPQDHPARDMQDTFYVKRPPEARLPRPDLVAAVRAAHEHGAQTGSRGWGYPWDEALARRNVLRTHTTAATIRALAEDPSPPRKVFCVGPVFRNETITYKHLPVFHQVDGILVDRKANLAALMGTLAAFYRKMGFERFQFRPSFFPYTEPSMEVFVWHAEKGDWVEMGGSGIFRPEVTEPLGCRVPVLAWGLGLERLAMFRYGLTRIRDLYEPPLSWLKETPLCPS